jgi:hypothetical protein
VRVAGGCMCMTRVCWCMGACICICLSVCACVRAYVSMRMCAVGIYVHNVCLYFVGRLRVTYMC